VSGLSSHLVSQEVQLSHKILDNSLPFHCYRKKFFYKKVWHW